MFPDLVFNLKPWLTVREDMAFMEEIEFWMLTTFFITGAHLQHLHLNEQFILVYSITEFGSWYLGPKQ